MTAVVGLVRFEAGPGAMRDNADGVIQQAGGAAQLGAGIVVFPLNSITGYGLGPEIGPDQAAAVRHDCQTVITDLLRQSLRHGLGRCYLLIGTLSWFEAGQPQAATVLIHQGRVVLDYSVGQPDPVRRPWAGPRRAAGQLVELDRLDQPGMPDQTRRTDYPGHADQPVVFQAHGVQFGIRLAATGLWSSWQAGPDGQAVGSNPDHQPKIVILTQGHGKCWAEDPTGQVLSQGQPSSRGLTLWHASQQSVPPKN